MRDLAEQADEIQILLSETPAVAEQLEGLERDYKHLFESYQDFSNKQLEATVQANLERRQLAEQFRVLEVAFMAPEPTSPNRSVIVILGVMFALAMGGAVGILLEATDPSAAHRAPAPGHAAASGAGGDPADLARVRSRGAAARPHPRRARDGRRRRLRSGRRRGQLRLGERRAIGGSRRRGVARRPPSPRRPTRRRPRRRAPRRGAPRPSLRPSRDLVPPCTPNSTA